MSIDSLQALPLIFFLGIAVWAVIFVIRGLSDC